MKNNLIRCILIIGILNISNIAFADTISDAQKSYKSGDYKKAYEYYKQAQVDDPQNHNLKYNMANAAYKSGKYSDAEQTFKNLSGSEISNDLKAKSLYNLGNTYYKEAKLQDAEKAYLDTLKLNKDDLSAKKNLEKVREEMKKKEKQEKKRKKNQEKNNKKQKDESGDKEKNKNGDKDNGKGKDNKNKPEDQNKKPDNNQKPEESKNEKSKFKEDKKSGGMTSQEAEKWLNSVKDDSKEVMKRQIMKKATQGYNSGKDW